MSANIIDFVQLTFTLGVLGIIGAVTMVVSLRLAQRIRSSNVSLARESNDSAARIAAARNRAARRAAQTAAQVF